MVIRMCSMYNFHFQLNAVSSSEYDIQYYGCNMEQMLKLLERATYCEMEVDIKCQDVYVESKFHL